MQATYAPDGGYIPRILFAEPSGKLRAEITNPAAGEQHKYFYQNVDMVRLVCALPALDVHGLLP